MINRTARYGLRAVAYLARRPDQFQLAAEVAAATRLPQPYLAKVLKALSEAGVLVSRKGPGGGFRLARPPRRLSLASVVTPLEDSRDADRCLLGRNRCRSRVPCPAHRHWQPVVAGYRRFLAATSVADLLGSRG